MTLIPCRFLGVSSANKFSLPSDNHCCFDHCYSIYYVFYFSVWFRMIKFPHNYNSSAFSQTGECAAFLFLENSLWRFSPSDALSFFQCSDYFFCVLKVHSDWIPAMHRRPAGIVSIKAKFPLSPVWENTDEWTPSALL